MNSKEIVNYLGSVHLLEDDTTAILNCIGKSGYLVIFGIDNLKNINTQYGREQGNITLKAVAQEIKNFGQEWSKVYRLDSDKFALNMEGATKEDVERLYAGVKEAVASFCTVSSGAVFYTEDSVVESVYQYAENALYTAKANGKNTQVFFSEELHEKHMKFIELQEEIRNCVRNDFAGFSVCYQPQIDARSYRMFGAEALLSFSSAIRGKILADEFISVLEHTKLIVEVGEWVLKQALIQCKKWRESRSGFHVSVNVSYIQLKEEGFAERILELLEEVGLPGKALTIEVTESIRLQDYQYFNKIFYKLKKQGIQIAIDDFGTGYSSLSYLKVLSIDEIKIDKCFVSHVQHSAYNYRLLSNIVELARSANIRVCCEGVEVEGELLAIQKLRPDLLQGYLFAKAYTVEQFEAVYLKPASPEYQERLRQELYYSSLDSSEHEDSDRIRQEKIGAIVDGMEEIIYVRDIDDYSLLYLNAAGREASGVYDYKGKKCYQVLQGKDKPCEFCQVCQNENNDYHVWEIESAYLNKHLLLKDKNIPWNGSIARLAVAIDVTEKEIFTKEVQAKLDFEQNIVACTKMLLEEQEKDKAIDGVLQSIGEFYAADRAYLFELKENKKFWDNTHEWCADAVEAQIANLQNVPISVTTRWMSLFEMGESIVIEDIESVKEISPDEYDILKMQNITNLLVSPVWKKGEAIGFIGVDNPKKHKTHCEQVQTMALFIADRLQKDENKQRLQKLWEIDHMRQGEFYHAILAEKEAYAEIDVESGRIISSGGCWSGYQEESEYTGVNFVELFNKHAKEFLHPEDLEKFEEFMSIEYLQRLLRVGEHTVKLEIRRQFGLEMHWAELTGHVFQDKIIGNVHALLYMKDIDAQKREALEREMEATRDPLTGVFNRRKFEKEVKKHMTDLDETGTGAMILLDMDYFKNINDAYGHAEGDRVLKHLADVLMKTFRRRDLIGRLGGDEFVVFLRNVTDKTILDRRMEELSRSLEEYSEHKLTCSIGISFAYSDTFSYIQCLEEADEALYRSKQAGRNRYTYFDEL